MYHQGIFVEVASAVNRCIKSRDPEGEVMCQNSLRILLPVAVRICWDTLPAGWAAPSCSSVTLETGTGSKKTFLFLSFHL